MFIKNSRGEKSGSFTFAAIAFTITSLSVILGILENVTFGEFSISLRSIDAATITAYLFPIMGLYFGRRWTESKFHPDPTDDASFDGEEIDG